MASLVLTDSSQLTSDTQHLGDGIVMQDGGPCHRAKLATSKLQEQDTSVLEQPRYELYRVCVECFEEKSETEAPYNQLKFNIYVEDDWPVRRSYRVEDFLWTGSGDGQDFILGSSELISMTVAHTTIFPTPVLTSPHHGPVSPTCCVTGVIRPTSTLGPPLATPRPTLPPVQAPDHRFWLLTVVQMNLTQVAPSQGDLENRLARLYRLAFNRQQEHHLGIGNATAQAILRQRLRRDRDRRVPEPVNVYLHNQSSEGSARLALLYSVHVDGKPVLAYTAAADMKLVSTKEATAELGFPILTKAEPYLKDNHPLDGGWKKARSRDTWLLVGSAVAAVALLLLLAVLLALGLGKRKRNKRRVLASSNRRQVFEREAGTANLAYHDEEDRQRVRAQFPWKAVSGSPPRSHKYLPWRPRGLSRSREAQELGDEPEQWGVLGGIASAQESCSQFTQEGKPPPSALSFRGMSTKFNSCDSYTCFSNLDMGVISDIFGSYVVFQLRAIEKVPEEEQGRPQPLPRRRHHTSHPGQHTVERGRYLGAPRLLRAALSKLIVAYTWVSGLPPMCSGNTDSECKRDQECGSHGNAVCEAQTIRKKTWSPLPSLEHTRNAQRQSVDGGMEEPVVPTINAAISPNSFLSMPSIKAFPRGASIPEPLARVLEPVSVKHLDSEAGLVLEPARKMARHGSLEGEDPGVVGPLVWDMHCHRMHCQPLPQEGNLIEDLVLEAASSSYIPLFPSAGCLEGNLIEDLVLEAASSSYIPLFLSAGCIEGNLIDDLVLEAAFSSYIPLFPSAGCLEGNLIEDLVLEAAPDDLSRPDAAAPNMGRMRQRFQELLDDAFSLFGSRSVSPAGGVEEDSSTPPTLHRVRSAIVRSITFVNEFAPRPRTSDYRRPATAAAGTSRPRGAWGTAHSSPPTGCSGTLPRPLSAGPFHRPQLPAPAVDRVLVLSEEQLPLADPAIPLIAAIKEELCKFRQPPAVSLPGST
uniref:Uncharacterized protein n=1 Tax=Timema shepardi TaxID=629360 RepID=A0A7R9FXG7_TIMSH|nr:unnamed protein product [Timema shepardi]